MDIKNRNFLVTGAGGLIGASIIEKLLRENVGKIIAFEKSAPPDKGKLAADWGNRVEWVEGDVTVKQNLLKVMDGVDGVFHTAALLTPVGFKNPRAVHEINSNGTLNILEACKEFDVKKIIFSSSVSVYGEPKTWIMDENHPIDTLTMYGISKFCGEKICALFHHLYGIDYVALRYTLIYGPRLHDRGNNSAFILGTIKSIREFADPVIEGDGSQLYDYLYVEDAARANISAMSSNVKNDVLNIGYGEVVSITDIVTLIMEIMNTKKTIVYRQKEQSFDISHIRVSVEKAKALLGFRARTSLRDGFRRLVEWYIGR